MGIFFISIEFTRDAIVLAYVFPSPLGIFFISMKAYPELSREFCNKFPSPMGFFFISISCCDWYDSHIIHSVSVPYGVLFYFYNEESPLYNNFEKLVSVPYGVLFYFYKVDRLTLDTYYTFPSPMGFFFISIYIVSCIKSLL